MIVSCPKASTKIAPPPFPTLPPLTEHSSKAESDISKELLDAM
jgi:hypothetical protein